MKAKHMLGLLLLTLFLTACEKSKNTGGDGEPMQGWAFQFIVVDTAGNNVFEPLPISYETGNPLPSMRDTTPFDPVNTYFVDGLGDKLQPLFGSTPNTGMSFKLYKDAVPMSNELDKTNSSTYQWLLYLTPNKQPDTISFKDPAIHGLPNVAEFILYNSDTLYKRGQEPYLFKIQFP